MAISITIAYLVFISLVGFVSWFLSATGLSVLPLSKDRNTKLGEFAYYIEPSFLET